MVGLCPCSIRIAYVLNARKRKKRSNYEEAVKAEHEEIKKGNYNYKGIEGK